MKIQRKPEWLRKKMFNRGSENSVKNLLRDEKLHTVCEEARCPNIGECFSRQTATFLLLGTVCTRNCRFCNISGSREILQPDPEEPARVTDAVIRLKLRFAVLTSVTRDDLPDGGAFQFVRTVEMIRQKDPQILVETLVPDFQGSENSILSVLRSGVHVFNHNLETVPGLYDRVRPMANYQRSLKVLDFAKRNSIHGQLIKTGIMAGLGESADEVLEVLRDFRRIGGDVFTIGQYLPPSKSHYPVKEYVSEEQFEFYRRKGEEIGIPRMISAPFVRSSYLAEKHFFAEI
jgi:lipoic acid synthetase